jgi:hypothetical protein
MEGYSVNASEFGGGSETGMNSAYGGTVDPNTPQAALPARLPAGMRQILVTNPANGKSVCVSVNDVGPWNTNDPYWDPSNQNGNRPMAENQYANKTKAQNGKVPDQNAGIDLTPAAMNALGVTGKPNTRQAPVTWSFSR